MTIVVRVKDNGPLIISAEDALLLRIEDGQGNVLTPNPDKPLKLCRCGASATKPFCDGAHNRIGFERPVVATETPTV